MKVALIGAGRMGQAIKQIAGDRGHDVVASFDSNTPFSSADANVLDGAEVGIDFTLPDLAVAHIEHAISLKLPLVVGTTGWDDLRDSTRDLVEREHGAVLYAANFSLGVALLRRALAAVGPLVDALDEYDIGIHEVHHTGKVDSPSGTARMLAEDVLRDVGRKKRMLTETAHGAIDPTALHVTSGRIGRVFGRHTVTIDSEVDEITLQHTAKSRDGFALGAVKAAEWLVGRVGFYSLDDAIESWLSPESQTEP